MRLAVLERTGIVEVQQSSPMEVPRWYPEWDNLLSVSHIKVFVYNTTAHGPAALWCLWRSSGYSTTADSDEHSHLLDPSLIVGSSESLLKTCCWVVHSLSALIFGPRPMARLAIHRWERVVGTCGFDRSH